MTYIRRGAIVSSRARPGKGMRSASQLAARSIACLRTWVVPAGKQAESPWLSRPFCGRSPQIVALPCSRLLRPAHRRPQAARAVSRDRLREAHAETTWCWENERCGGYDARRRDLPRVGVRMLVIGRVVRRERCGPSRRARILSWGLTAAPSPVAALDLAGRATSSDRFKSDACSRAKLDGI